MPIQLTIISTSVYISVVRVTNTIVSLRNVVRAMQRAIVTIHQYLGSRVDALQSSTVARLGSRRERGLPRSSPVHCDARHAPTLKLAGAPRFCHCIRLNVSGTRIWKKALRPVVVIKTCGR